MESILEKLGIGDRSESLERGYLSGPYAPCQSEVVEPVELKVTGAIPDEVCGSYFRNGPNPRFPQFSKYHWFDGDGMIHRLQIRDKRAFYSRRYVQTKGLKWETALNRRLFLGVKERPPGPALLKVLWNILLNGEVLKDTSNTDLVVFRERLLSLWWLSGRPYALNPETLETEGVADFEGTYRGTMAAHARVDPNTGELFFLNFHQLKPKVGIGKMGSNGRLAWFTEFDDLEFPRIYHDLVFTKHYAILMDFPLGYLHCEKAGRRVPQFLRDKPSRVALLDRDTGKVVHEFKFEANYVLHAINAYERDDELVLTVCKYLDPVVSDHQKAGNPEVGFLNVDTHVVHWRFSLAGSSPTFREETVTDQNTEFPRINEDYLGKPHRYAFCPKLLPSKTVKFGSILKLDFTTGASTEMNFGPGIVGEEPVFITRSGGTEDQGWLGVPVHDLWEQRSAFHLFDGETMDSDPVARIEFPESIPLGFHSKWLGQSPR